MVLGNLWIFSSAVSSIMSSDPTTDAIQRTTTVRKYYKIFANVLHPMGVPGIQSL